MRAQIAAEGRDPQSVLIFNLFTPIVGRTEKRRRKSLPSLRAMSISKEQPRCLAAGRELMFLPMSQNSSLNLLQRIRFVLL